MTYLEQRPSCCSLPRTNSLYCRYFKVLLFVMWCKQSSERKHRWYNTNLTLDAYAPNRITLVVRRSAHLKFRIRLSIWKWRAWDTASFTSAQNDWAILNNNGWQRIIARIWTGFHYTQRNSFHAVNETLALLIAKCYHMRQEIYHFSDISSVLLL